MVRFNGLRARLAVVGAGWALTGWLVSGQAPAAPTPLVIDTGALTPFVENMDRTLAFYHDVFDMDVPIVYDCAHAAGSAWDAGDKVCCWSFHAVKNLATGEQRAVALDLIAQAIGQ